MNQEKSQKQICVKSYFRKSICAAMILLSWLSLVPSTAMAVGGVAATKELQQQVTANGKVVDEGGEPVIGASVTVEGTTKGTITDVDGNFSLSVSPGATLTVSYIGYSTLQVKVGDKPLTITLKENNEILDEVVVVGYGAVKRANLVGAVSSVNMKEMADMPAANLSSVLMGTMPGVTVGEATGNPIGNTTIKIRINGSWNAEEPLYVIDGFIRDSNAFNLLDPSEVETISVLKDAQASVYGVRGAGGVILVTTRKGSQGKTKISYSGSYGTSQGIKMPEMMSAYEHASMLNDLWNQSVDTGSDPTSLFTKFSSDELTQLKGIGYDWLDMAWKNSSNTRHTLNVSGGSEKVRYFLGGSYMWQDGNFENLDMNRFSFRSGVDIDFTKDLKANISLNYSSKSTQMPLNQKDAEADRMYGTFSDLVRAPRWVAPYINGLPVGNSITGTGTHPLEVMQTGSYKKNRSDDFSGGASFDYSFPWVKGLKASLSVNYSRSSSNGKQISKPYTLYNFLPNGNLISDQQYNVSDKMYKIEVENANKIEESASFSYSYQLNPKISYANKFGKHDVSGMLVYEQSESGGNNLSAYRTGLDIDNYDVLEGFNEAGMGNKSGINTLSRRQSYIGRLNYIYADRYFVEAAARYEASTNFSPGNRWGLFPSVALGWRISEESFFKDNVHFMDNLKLRVSYGRLGSDKVSMGQWRLSYTKGTGAYVGGTGLSTALSPSMEGLVYMSSSWEKTDSYNAGIDMRFFHDFSVGIDGFYRYAFDILDDAKSEFPQSSGINGQTPKKNSGIQKSWGGELELGYNKQLTKNWGVFAKGNFAYATNKIIKKYQNPGVVGTWRDEIGTIRGGETGYSCMGIARTQKEVDDYVAYLKSNLKDPNDEILVFGMKEADLKPGMLMFKDMGSAAYKDENGIWHDGAPDGKIDENGDQRVISKYSSPPFNYGFTLGFTWKSLKVDALFSGSFGNDVFFDKGFYTTASGGKRSGDFLSLQSNNLKEWAGNYWTEDNQNAKYPRLVKGLKEQRSTFWMRDGHTLRLRTVNVSYSLPNAYAKAVGLDQLRVFFSGTNLLTLVNPYPYKDASVSFWSDYPMIRTFNFGVNLSF